MTPEEKAREDREKEEEREREYRERVRRRQRREERQGMSDLERRIEGQQNLDKTGRSFMVS